MVVAVKRLLQSVAAPLQAPEEAFTFQSPAQVVCLRRHSARHDQKCDGATRSPVEHFKLWGTPTCTRMSWTSITR